LTLRLEIVRLFHSSRRRNKNMRLTFLTVLLFTIFESTSSAQLGDFKCPMTGSPPIRQGDSVAPSGGRFDSPRAGGKKHGALDLNGKLGDAVFASMEGMVAVADPKWDKMGGTVIIDHGSGAYTVYGHLDSVLVKEGVRVKVGDKIGTVGYTGNAEDLKTAGLPPHLHFALIQAGKSGVANANKPLRQMKAWADYWQGFGADLTGPVDPALFMQADANCWTGSTTMNAPGEH
jgi:murein DD-endopeptidase MepM/ murein hydrolase activator NlpD